MYVQRVMQYPGCVLLYSLELAGGATGDKPLDEMSKDDLFAQLLKAGGEESVKKLRLFRSKIKLNESFSGIKFKSVDWEIKEKGQIVDFNFNINFLPSPLPRILTNR